MDLKKRFVDNGDGTVTDLETKLMWKQTDSFQDTSQWTNWFKAFEYIRSLELLGKTQALFSDHQIVNKEADLNSDDIAQQIADLLSKKPIEEPSEDDKLH